MEKVENQITYGLNTSAGMLGFSDPEELLWLVVTELHPLGRLPYIFNGGNPLLIRFTMQQINTIEKKLKEAGYERCC